MLYDSFQNIPSFFVSLFFIRNAWFLNVCISFIVDQYFTLHTDKRHFTHSISVEAHMNCVHFSFASFYLALFTLHISHAFGSSFVSVFFFLSLGMFFSRLNLFSYIFWSLQRWWFILFSPFQHFNGNCIRQFNAYISSTRRSVQCTVYRLSNISTSFIEGANWTNIDEKSRKKRNSFESAITFLCSPQSIVRCNLQFKLQFLL